MVFFSFVSIDKLIDIEAIVLFRLIFCPFENLAEISFYVVTAVFFDPV